MTTLEKELIEVLSTMLGYAEADGMDAKSNLWRSVMLRANEVLGIQENTNESHQAATD